MSNISIRREHQLSHAQAVDAVNRIAARLNKEYGVVSRWEGPALYFDRTGLSGTVVLSGSKLEFDIKLGFLMSAFRERISQAVEQTLQEEFAPKSTRKPRSKPART